MTIIDVSGHNNNCGLYSLALAVSLAITEKGAHPNSVPDYIVTIGEQNVSSNAPTDTLELIGQLLRGELAEALKANATFEEGYFNAFIDICLNSSREGEPDMQALVASNYPLIKELRSNLDMLLLNNAAIPIFESSISPDKLNLCIEKLNATIQLEHFDTSILESYLQINYPDTTIEQLYECCEAFFIAWNKITIQSPKIPEIKKFIINWFFREASRLYSESGAESAPDLLCELGECRRFIGGVGQYDIHNAREVYMQIQVRKAWGSIYSNYIEYVSTKPVMLSSDELSCLATQWNVKLHSITQDGRHSQSILERPGLEVELVNLTQNHWQVNTDVLDDANTQSPVQKIKESYQYTSQDIKQLIEIRLPRYIPKSLDKFQKAVKVNIVENNSDDDLIKILRLEQNSNVANNARTLLIPYQLEKNIWVGVYIDFDKGGKIAKAKFICSNAPYTLKEHQHFEKIKKTVLELHGDCAWEHEASLAEVDSCSSAVHVVESLLHALSSKLNKPPYTLHAQRMFNAALATNVNPYVSQQFYNQDQETPKSKDISKETFEIYNKYEYDSEDLTEILASRLKGSKKPSSIHIMAVANNYSANSLYTALLPAKSLGGERTVLIPCHLRISKANEQKHRYHWVGIVLDFINGGNTIRVLRIDSMIGIVDRAYELLAPLVTDLRKIYPNATLPPIECLQQDDMVSSGTYLIENILRYLQLSAANVNKTTEQLRQEDLQSLYASNPEFFAKFNKKQLQDKPEVMSEDVDELFKTITNLGKHVDAYFSDKQTSITDEEQKVLNTKFHTVYNKGTGTLELQLNAAENLEEVQEFLASKPFSENKLLVAKDYGSSAFLGFASGSTIGGVAGLVGIGEGATVIGEAVTVGRAAMLAEGFSQGAMVGLRSLVSPALLIPGVAIMGISVTRTYLSRSYSQSIQEALKLYHLAINCEDVRLDKAVKLLEDSLGIGVTNPAYHTRAFRWLGASSNQYIFAQLLMAQIYMEQKKNDSLAIFEPIYKNTTNQTFKAMSLIGKIRIYADPTLWDIKRNDVALAPEIRQSELDKMVETLNSDHKDIIKCYFAEVWKAYSDMFEAIKNSSFLKSEEEFLKVRDKIERINAFKDLACLKFMNPHGKMAEVLFIFVQGLANAILEQRYVHLKKSHDDKSQDNKIKNSRELVKNKFERCTALMNTYELTGMFNDFSPKYNIVATLEKYRDYYLDKCAAIARAELNTSDYYTHHRSGKIASESLPPVLQKKPAENALRNSAEVNEADKQSLHSLTSRKRMGNSIFTI